MADTTYKIWSTVPTPGLATLLVKKARAEHLRTSSIGAYLELSKIIPMMVRDAMMYMTKISTEIGVMPC